MSRVLILDDQQVIHSILSTYLKKLNIESVSFYNAYEALQFLSKNKIDVILTDLSMPLIDGFYVIEQVKKTNDKNIRIIAMSGVCNNSEDIKKAVSLGAKDYLLKPIDFDILKNKLSFLKTEAETWSEWKVDNKKISNKGTFLTEINLVSLSEISLTIMSNTLFTEGEQLKLSFEIFSGQDISYLLVEVIKSEIVDDRYLTQLKILGSNEKLRSAIRRICRQLDSSQIILNNIY